MLWVVVIASEKASAPDAHPPARQMTGMMMVMMRAKRAKLHVTKYTSAASTRLSNAPLGWREGRCRTRVAVLEVQRRRVWRRSDETTREARGGRSMRGMGAIRRGRGPVIRVVMTTSALAILTVGHALAQGIVEAEARAALDEYFRAWNAADNEAIVEVSNFPRLSLGANGQVVVRQSSAELEIDFDVLRQVEGWDHTTVDLVEAVHIAPDKVHYRIVSSRRRSDGSAYRTGPALYVFTRQDGHWGLQLQSVLPPTFTAQ